MRNLSVKVSADIGGYTTNMELAARVARDKMGDSTAAVEGFQKSIQSSADEVQRASASMGANMDAANEAIMSGAKESAAAIDEISKSAKATDVSSLGEKISDALAIGAANAKTQWEGFSAWAEAKSKATGIAIGIILAGTLAGAIYTAYKLISASVGFISGLFTGESYKSENIDALIKANDQVKELATSLGITAQQAQATAEAIKLIGGSQADYVSVFDDARKAVRSNTEELDRLKIAYKDANGQQLATADVIKNVNDKLNQYTEGWDRNQAAASIGIGTAAQVAAAVLITSQKIDEAKSHLDEYNLGIGADSQEAVKRYENAVRDFNHENDLMAQGFKRAIADNVMPLLTDLAEFFTGGFPFAVNVFRYTMATVTSLFYGLKTSTYIVAESILGSVQSIGLTLEGLATATVLVMKGDFTGAKDALVKGWADAKARIGEIGDNIVTQAQHNAAAMRQAWAFDDRSGTPSAAARPLGLKWVPKPEDDDPAQKDDVNKAIMEGALKAQEAFIAAEKAQLQTREQFLQSYYAQEYLTARQFYGTRQQLIEDALKAELQAYDKEIAALKVYRATRGEAGAGSQVEREKQDADNRIAEVEKKKAAAIVEANKQITLSYIDRAQVQRQFDLQTIEANRQMTLQNDAAQFSLDMMGKSTLEVQKATAARQIQLAVEDRIYQIRKKDPDADVSQALLDAQAQTVRAQEIIEQQWQKQRDGWFGATEAIRKYAEAANDAGGQVENALTNAFKSAEDALVTFVKTGKTDFKSLADSIISDLIRIQVRTSITGPLADAAKESGGLFGLIGKALGGGGSQPEQLGFSASQLASFDVPSFDVGTDYVPQDMLAQIHRGEKIIPANQNDGGGVTIHYAPVTQVDSRTDRAEIYALIDAGHRRTVAQIPDLVRRGGGYAKSVRG